MSDSDKLSGLRLPWPVDWTALFGTSRPLVVEIGFGYGTYLLHLARSHPDASIIGFEIAGQCLRHVERAVARLRLPNVRLIHATAETALHHLFQPASIDQIHVNFPDPWFKKRHSHRRLMQRDTLDAMINRLVPGGLLYLATDIVEYAEMSHEILAASPGLDNVLPAPWADEMPGRIMTKYEGKARREGRPCFYFAYRRNIVPPPTVPVIEELPMPHVVFTSPLTLDDMAARFTGIQHSAGETHIRVIEGFRGNDSLLFEVFIKEPTLDQHIAFLLVPRARSGEFTLKLSTIGHPRSTPGVHRAVGLLGDYLIALHPDSRLLQRSLKDS